MFTLGSVLHLHEGTHNIIVIMATNHTGKIAGAIQHNFYSYFPIAILHAACSALLSLISPGTKVKLTEC